MAEITNSGHERGKGKKGRRRLAPVRVDFTPMVDLACLLLTFFMLTTAFTKPKIMEVSMPKDGTPTPWEPRTMTVLLDESKEKIHYYFGEFEPSTHLYVTSLSKDGLRKQLFDKKGSVPVLIRTGEKARYETVVDVIDELNLCGAGTYAIADMSEEEAQFLEAKKLTAERR